MGMGNKNHNILLKVYIFILLVRANSFGIFFWNHEMLFSKYHISSSKDQTSNKRHPPVSAAIFHTEIKVSAAL